MDSGFPIGGFAHSSGLEAAWQAAEVRHREELVPFLTASLEQQGHAALPFVAASFDSPEQLPELNKLSEAFINNHVANRASRTQGRALLTAVERTFKLKFMSGDSRIEFVHLAPVFGASMRRLQVSRDTALRMFLFNHLRGVLAAAVRLNVVGPMEAQSLQHRLARKAELVLHECGSLSLDDIAQTAPLLDLWFGMHDRLYSRLFQS